LLTYCIRNQNSNAVLSLIKQGDVVNVANLRDVTPLAAAAHKGNGAIMTALIDAGALVDGLNNAGSTALIQVDYLMFILTILTLVFGLNCLGLSLWSLGGSANVTGP
jgi:hypothetical protein